jgi:hypothetical protein
VEALQPAIAAFQAMLRSAAEEVQHRLVAIQTSTGDRVSRMANELGPFGAHHVDVARLTPLLGVPEVTDRHTVEMIEHALATLRDLVGSGDSLHVLTVPPNERPHEAVEWALARIGRGFGAARAVASLRSGNYKFADHARSLGSFPFARWTRTERLLAPPLVVEVTGTELSSAGLAEFLDGRSKIVLVVVGPCSPAPLARLITPGMFVMQAADAADLKRLADWDGPGIAALVPEGAARFVHDPSVSAPSPRLVLGNLPDGTRRRPVGGLSVAQQMEELRLLSALAAAPAAAAAPVAAAASAASAASSTNGAATDPAAKLAAWLLSQVDLSDLG